MNIKLKDTPCVYHNYKCIYAVPKAAPIDPAGRAYSAFAHIGAGRSRRQSGPGVCTHRRRTIPQAGLTRRLHASAPDDPAGRADPAFARIGAGRSPDDPAGRAYSAFTDALHAEIQRHALSCRHFFKNTKGTRNVHLFVNRHDINSRPCMGFVHRSCNRTDSRILYEENTGRGSTQDNRLWRHRV